jgi:hypothetical protein
MTVEAKSEQHPDGLLALHDVRQANTQIDQLASERRCPILDSRGCFFFV